jgi:hypothetical protein
MRVQHQSLAHWGLGGVRSVTEGNDVKLDDISFDIVIVDDLEMEKWF